MAKQRTHMRAAPHLLADVSRNYLTGRIQVIIKTYFMLVQW